MPAMGEIRLPKEEKRNSFSKFDKIADSYNLVDFIIPADWRRKAAAAAYGRVLEVGIGTGLNLPFYTAACTEAVGIDVSPRMLGKAEKQAAACPAPVSLAVMDVERLTLPAASFDCVLAAFVFCSVPDPAAGLEECRRVLKPGGRLILLEHMDSDNKLAHALLILLEPLTLRRLGDHLTRRTAEAAKQAGFHTVSEEKLFGDVVRMIITEKREERQG